MRDNHINYVEFKALDLTHIKAFYQSVFGWIFTDYGPTYIAFSNSWLEGGFELSHDIPKSGTLVVLYHTDLKKVRDAILKAGGRISKDTFSFPGGHRFHFKDPSGNELAIWSDR